MQGALDQPARRWLLVGGMLLTATYLAAVSLQLIATRYSSSHTLRSVRRAARLDPLNAAYAFQIGERELVEGQSPARAMAWLERATALNPHRAQYWLVRALASQSFGDIGGEEASLQQALSVDPRTPDVAWQAANLYLAQGSQDLAMKEFRVVLENDASLASGAIQTCWKVRPDVDFLLREVIPPAAQISFLDFLISRNENGASARVWDEIVASHQKIGRSHLFDYIRHLLARRETEQAVRVWQQAAEAADLQAYQPSSQNLIVNGNFSLKILNAGFDWIHQKTPGVNLALDPNETHSSPRSLRITFDGAGMEDAGIRQIIAVEPDRAYEFSAFYKAQEMDGAGGARFTIQDLYRETRLYVSDDLGNADFWKKISGRFTTAHDTRLVMLKIAREPPGSPIRGRLWIDALQLASADGALASRAGENH